MEYRIEKSGYNVKINFSLTNEEWEQAMSAAYQKTKGKYRVQGFRPGKAPRKVIENFYGPATFFEDAFNECFPKVYSEVVDKEKLEPVDRPELDFDDISDKGVEFSARVVVKPEVKLGAYKGLTIEKPVYEFDAGEVDREINSARERNARKTSVSDRAAIKGDFVVIDYSGSVDGEKFAGGTAEMQELELGSGSFIPGFEEQVEGMSVGDEKDINVKFPDEYHAEELKGKNAVFAVKLHEIKVKELPALDDEFAKDVSEFDTMADYRASIEKRIKESNEKRAESDTENKLLEQIAAGTEIDIPEVMIEEQIDAFLEEFEQRLRYQGLNSADYFRYTGTTPESFRKERRDEAKRTVTIRLTVQEIVKAEKLEATDADVEAKLVERAERIGKPLDEVKASASQSMLDYLKNDVVMDKLMALLKAENTFTTAAAPKAAKKPAAKKPAKKD